MIKESLCLLLTDYNPECTYTIQKVCQNIAISRPKMQWANIAQARESIKKFLPYQQEISGERVCPATHTYLCDLRGWEILLKPRQSPLSDVSCGSTTVILFSILFGALSKVFNSRISSHTVLRSQALMYSGVNSSKFYLKCNRKLRWTITRDIAVRITNVLFYTYFKCSNWHTRTCAPKIQRFKMKHRINYNTLV